MKLSTKGRYGVLAMVELSLHYGKGPISIKEIAEKQSFSDSYMEQLFSALKRAGLVKSIRGARGGYILSRDPDEIIIGDIIRALEGPIELADCIAGYNCEKSAECLTRGLWTDVMASISQVIDNRTLQDLLDGKEA
ncbi:Rrf2 family transcriptional regulator [Eubacteriaceae bacterium ES3]|nr:Rrf2 family transcriptional regulator [Eubacteriaceae bacterium ES3]